MAELQGCNQRRGSWRLAGWAALGALAMMMGLAPGGGAQTLPELAAVPLSAPLPAPSPLQVYGVATTADPVGAGDVLEVRVFGQPQLSGDLRVAANGEIAPPFVSNLEVAGERPEEIQAALTTAYGRLLTHPLVSVRLVENNSRKVSVNGEVPRPGVYAFSGRLTLLQALAMAGGVNRVKASNEVLLLHTAPVAASTGAGGEPVYTANTVLETIDLSQMAAHPELNRGIHPGDVIDVQEAEQVYISGDVMRPGSSTLLPDMTLTQLISQSGGMLPQADGGHVRVLRLLPNGQRQTLVADVGAAQKNRRPELALKANDIVLVPGSLLRMTGLELLDFFTETGRWRVNQTVANKIF
ncbi:MAG: SLBB domain-containing protein [Terriglobales bacterium]